MRGLTFYKHKRKIDYMKFKHLYFSVCVDNPYDTTHLICPWDVWLQFLIIIFSNSYQR